MNDRSWRIWVARLLIGVVTFWNLLAAIQFLTRPAVYAPGFELEGAAGSAMIQGMGLLFVMWNIPYLIALLNPVRNRLSLTEAVIMQIIGAAGETLLLSSLQGDHLAIRSTVTRFILFDSIGVLLLVAAWVILRKRITGQE
jgi:hypothetical protein